MFDGIEFRGFSQKMVEELAEFSGVPVWNGLTDEWHPTQMIADFLTIHLVQDVAIFTLKRLKTMNELFFRECRAAGLVFKTSIDLQLETWRERRLHTHMDGLRLQA